MGFIALTGIIVNNSILLIDRMNEMRREKPEVSIDTVVIEAAASRLRPIILTSLTTIVGMIPLLYSDPIWVPLATAIIFGLTFSVVITLVLVPIIYDRWPGKLTK
jgi:multidrug efflux pump subunit AcrB